MVATAAAVAAPAEALHAISHWRHVAPRIDKSSNKSASIDDLVGRRRHHHLFSTVVSFIYYNKLLNGLVGVVRPESHTHTNNTKLSTMSIIQKQFFPSVICTLFRISFSCFQPRLSLFLFLCVVVEFHCIQTVNACHGTKSERSVLCVADFNSMNRWNNYQNSNFDSAPRNVNLWVNSGRCCCCCCRSISASAMDSFRFGRKNPAN